MAGAPTLATLRRPGHARDVEVFGAAGLLVGAALALWLVPPLGVVAGAALGVALAPWGRRLGERILIVTVVAAGSVAIVLAFLQISSSVLPWWGWRIGATAVLLAEAAAVWARGSDRWLSAPRVWPEVGRDDVIALVTGVALFALLGVPYLISSSAQVLSGLLGGWDHSSHLPMFVQTMHAQGWNSASLGDDVMFAVYPMLHTGLWSVGEWVAGVSPQVAGTDLIHSYVAWSTLTASLSAVLLVATSAVAARTFSAQASRRAAARVTPVLAASFTAAWCLVGTFALMADFAFSNFLFGSALAGAAVVVGARSRAAMVSSGWLVLPLGVVATSYAYTPLAGGVAVAALITLVVLVRGRSLAALGMVGLSLVCAVAVLPAARIVTEPFAGRQVGDIKGGLPPFELIPGLIMATVVVVVVLSRFPSIRLANRLALLAPVVVTAVLAALFAAQTVGTSTSLGDSYYTKKICYAVLLLALPLAMGLLGARVARTIPVESGRPRTLRVVAAIGVSAVVLAVVSVATGGPDPATDGALRWLRPVGVWAALDRVALLTGDDGEGRAVLAAAAQKSGWVTVVSVGDHGVESGRMAAGLGAVLTVADNEVIEVADEEFRDLARVLSENREVRVRVVVGASNLRREAEALREDFGDARVEVLVLGGSLASG